MGSAIVALFLFLPLGLYLKRRYGYSKVVVIPVALLLFVIVMTALSGKAPTAVTNAAPSQATTTQAAPATHVATPAGPSTNQQILKNVKRILRGDVKRPWYPYLDRIEVDDSTVYLWFSGAPNDDPSQLCDAVQDIVVFSPPSPRNWTRGPAISAVSVGIPSISGDVYCWGKWDPTYGPIYKNG